MQLTNANPALDQRVVNLFLLIGPKAGRLVNA